MKDTLEKIKTLLSIDNKESKEVKMYAEMILDDGRVVATEDEQFMIGSEVFVVNDDGEASPLSAGSYTMEDGAKLTIDDEGKILDMGEEKEAEDVEASEEVEEMAEEADVADWEGMEKRIKNLEDAVADLKADHEKIGMSEETEETVEEEVEEVKEEEKVEMSKDMVTSLVEEIEHLKTKLSEMEETPGAEGFTHNPETKTKSNSKVDLAKMTASERAAYYINNK
jgi:hypothetical protein